ncbi:hypothetical protein [Escherichia phage RDN8.1]|nr:hypothetical protein [Escherichia phage RDN8.1]
MIKLIEFLGRLVVRGYARAASVERKVASVEAKLAEELAAKSQAAQLASQDASWEAKRLETKAAQLSAFFK